MFKKLVHFWARNFLKSSLDSFLPSPLAPLVVFLSPLTALLARALGSRGMLVFVDLSLCGGVCVWVGVGGGVSLEHAMSIQYYD